MLTKMVSICWPRDPPASASQSAGIKGLSHSAQPYNALFYYFLEYIQQLSMLFQVKYRNSNFKWIEKNLNNI